MTQIFVAFLQQVEEVTVVRECTRAPAAMNIVFLVMSTKLALVKSGRVRAGVILRVIVSGLPFCLMNLAGVFINLRRLVISRIGSLGVVRHIVLSS